MEDDFKPYVEHALAPSDDEQSYDTETRGQRFYQLDAHPSRINRYDMHPAFHKSLHDETGHHTQLPAAFSEEDSNDAASRGRIWYYLNVTALGLCVFLGSVDAVDFAAALPAVTADLNASATSAVWSGTASLLARCVTQPVTSAFAEAFGRRWTLIASLGVYAASSLLAAAAGNIATLIAARALQGLGIGAVNTCTNILMVDLAPPEKRPMLVGLTGLCGAAGLLLGVLVGSGAADYNWRLLFYLNIPVPVITIIIIFFSLHLPHKQQGRFWDQIRGIDWIGTALLTASTGSFIYALISGGTVFAWSSPLIIAPLAVGGLGMLGFVAFEHMVAGRFGLGKAFIPLRIFSTRTASFGYLMSFLHMMILWAILYYYLLYIHINTSRTFFQSSIIILPTLILLTSSAAVSGILVSRLNHFKYFNVAAFVLFITGCGGLSSLGPDPSVADLVGFQVLFGIGAGIFYPGRLMAVQIPQRIRADGDEADLRIASGLISFFASLGQAFGVAMGGTALQNAWDEFARQALERGQLGDQSQQLQFFIPGSLATVAAEILRGFPDDIAAIYREIAARSIARIWYACIGLSALGILAAVFSRNLPILPQKCEKGVEVVDEDMEVLTNFSQELAITQYSHIHSSRKNSAWHSDKE